MNKAELIDFIAQDMEITKAQAGQFLDSFVNAVQNNISEEGVKLSGFGTFARAKRAARVGRNPATGEEIKIPAKWVPVFKAGSALKDAVQSKR